MIFPITHCLPLIYIKIGSFQFVWQLLTTFPFIQLWDQLLTSISNLFLWLSSEKLMQKERKWQKGKEEKTREERMKRRRGREAITILPILTFNNRTNLFVRQNFASLLFELIWSYLFQTCHRPWQAILKNWQIDDILFCVLDNVL